MRLLVTGAGGFLGRYIVAAAVKRGHIVRAVVRPASREVPPSWVDHPQVEIVRADLRSRTGLAEMLEGVDTVIHAAAVKGGDYHAQFAGSVVATENLLRAMNDAGVRHLVATSSFAVYEYLHRRSWSVLDEQSPLTDDPRRRDGYCQTKLIQEQLIKEAAEDPNWRVAILRPGVIYGRDALWFARVGSQIGGRWWLRTGASLGRLPLTYVENCAEAIVLAAEYDGPDRSLILNIVDSDLPTTRSYVRMLRKMSGSNARLIPVPWPAWRVLARLAWTVNTVFMGGTAKLPGILVPARIHAIAKPMRFRNRRAVETLGWRPRFSWREGLARSCGTADLTCLAEADRAASKQVQAVEQPA